MISLQGPLITTPAGGGNASGKPADPAHETMSNNIHLSSAKPDYFIFFLDFQKTPPHISLCDVTTIDHLLL
jgi:hypothetical protein